MKSKCQNSDKMLVRNKDFFSFFMWKAETKICNQLLLQKKIFDKIFGNNLKYLNAGVFPNTRYFCKNGYIPKSMNVYKNVYVYKYKWI